MMQATKQRRLTEIIQAIRGASDVDAALERGTRATYGALLEPFGESTNDYTSDQRLKQSDFAIPAYQSFAIAGAVMTKANDPIEAVTALLDWSENAPYELAELTT